MFRPRSKYFTTLPEKATYGKSMTPSIQYGCQTTHSSPFSSSKNYQIQKSEFSIPKASKICTYGYSTKTPKRYAEKFSPFLRKFFLPIKKLDSPIPFPKKSPGPQIFLFFIYIFYLLDIFSNVKQK